MVSRLEGKESRNDETGKDHNERFLQNLKVLQRVRDYGLSCLRLGRRSCDKGCVIDLTRNGEILVSLNTNSDSPKQLGRAKDVEVVKMKKAAKPKMAKSKSPKKAA